MNAPQDHAADYLPSNIQAEQALLGYILMRNDTYLNVAEIVRADFFLEPLHQKIFEMIAERLEAGAGVTPLTLIAVLGKDAQVAIAGETTVAKYLARLAAEGVSTTIPATEYAKTVRDLWTRRQIINLSREMMQRAAGGFDDDGVEAILDGADQELASIRYGKTVAGVAHIGELAARALSQTASAYQTTAKVGFDTGISAIDAIMGPIMPGDVLTLIGPSGGGKSALAAQILCRNCEPSLDTNRGISGLFISQEMGGAQIARRVLATHTGISTRAQRSGEVLEAEYGFLQDAASKMQSLPFYVDESGMQTARSIIRKLRAMKARYGIKIAVIDHLLLIQPENNRWSKFDTIEQAMMKVKDAAKALDMVIIMIAQLTQESQKRETTWRVRGVDVFGGGMIKQCSDVLMTVTLPHKWLREHEPSDDRHRGKWEADCLRWDGKAEVGFPKIRDGEDGKTTSVGFEGVRMWFKDE